MKIKELLTDESRWIKGAFAKDKNGNIINTRDPNAVCWCLTGAISKCYAEYYNFTKYYSLMTKLCAKVSPHTLHSPHSSILIWNDAPERTFEEVKQLVEELDI